MGDKTQLLTLVLIARYRKPWTVLAGIFIATLLNHGLASYAGSYVTQFFSANTLRWLLGLCFVGFGLWILIPDKEEEIKTENKWGPFLTTLVAFFFAEMADKTQFATIALAAKYPSPLIVTIGSTLGMMAANGLAVAFGHKLTERIPMKYIHGIASVIFVAFGIAILLGF